MVAPHFRPDRFAGRQAGAWRNAGRFSLTCDVSFRKSTDEGPAGQGRTVNISSSGVLFRTDQKLQVGDELILTLRWPLHLAGEHALDLKARGKVVRVRAGMVAVYFLKCEFRKAPIPGS